jgi:DNA-binding beta-propeller fold protein YncE
VVTNIPSTITFSAIASVTVGTIGDLAINTKTNKIYIRGEYVINDPTLTNFILAIGVIDGTTDAVSVLQICSSPLSGSNNCNDPGALAVNSTTNMVYGSGGTGAIMVFNGETNVVTAVNAETNSNFPKLIVVDEGTNRIYMINQESNYVTILYGATNGTETVALTNDQYAVDFNTCSIALNTTTHKVYVVNKAVDTVTVISGNAITTVPTTTTLTSDTNQAQSGSKVTFTAYVAETDGPTVPTGNVVFKVDGASVFDYCA